MKWEKVKLGNYVKILSGYPFESNQFSDKEGKPLIRIRDIKRGFTETFYTGKYEEAYLIKQGDLLIGMDGEFNIASWEGEESLLNQRVCKIETEDFTILDNNYLKHFLPQELKKIENRTAFVTVKHLSVKSIENIQIPLPPLPEQKRIAAILDKADALRRKDDELLKKYDELAQSIFIDMFGDPVKNEKGWDIEIIDNVINKARPITYGILKPGANVKPDGVPYIRVVDIKDNIILREKVCYTSNEISNQYKRSLLKKGDLLYSIRGHVGRSCIVPKHFEGANITQDTARLDFDIRVKNVFAFGYMNTESFHRLVRPLIRGAAVKGLNLGDLRELPIPIPDIRKQEQYEINLKTIWDLKQKETVNYKKSDNLFQSLLQQAFKGEL